MKVDAFSAGTFLQEARITDQDHHVQNVFSEILRAAGRRGYQSAEDVTDEQISAEGVKKAWEDWFQSQRSGRYAAVTSPEELKQGFGKVLSRAHAEGGYIQPKEFLKRLAAEELEAVQNAHWLADPIDVDSLTEEGALNLLLPGAAQVDANGDGLTQTGVAYGIKFPDSNTPASVVEAWEVATAGMDLRERMIYELQMKLPLLTANMHVDENGVYSHHYEPGDPEFRNPMAEAGYSYVQATQNQLDYLEFMKSRISTAEYDRQTEFWNRLQGLLIDRDA